MTESEVLSLVRPEIASLVPYSTARDEYKGAPGILLDANESPYGNGLNRYPPAALRAELVGRVAAVKGIPRERLFLGNGSDECIDLCYRVFCRPGTDNALIISPSYGMYQVCADINGVQRTLVPLNPDFSLPVEALLDSADGNSRLLFICSPNNPTANTFAEKDIRRILDGFGGMVVLDEAYADFSERGSLKALLDEYPNLIILQTLSKAYGMAGLRIGLALSAPQITDIFNNVRYPYNIGTDTISLALELLDKGQDHVEEILRERGRLMEALRSRTCIREVLPSDANFFLIRCERPRELYDFLIVRGIIVRDRSTTPGCGPALRITVGTPDENDRLIQATDEYDSIQGIVH